jgi:tetratricopeptide (TPR) repeat protein
MPQFAIFVLIAWVPITIVLFTAMPARNAAVTSVVGAWLLLPAVAISLPGIPDYTKVTASTFGILIGAALFDSSRLFAFRPRWFDVPILVWCICPFASSISNNDGVYDGVSQSLGNIFPWGLPYLIGRLYFGDLAGLRALAVGVVVGGLAYIPPCLFEMRMSPILAPMIYATGKWGGVRLGGYRPRVFLLNGLELGMWMCAASLAAYWLWRSGSLKQVAGFPFGKMLLASLWIVNILCRSTGALILFMGGIVTLWGSVRFKTKTLLLGIMLLTPAYYTVRINGLWSGEGLLDVIKERISEERAWSVEFRFRNENLLIERALERPILGWGGFGRSLDIDKAKLKAAGVHHRAIPDGLWIIALGGRGFVGLASITLVILLPPILFLGRFRVNEWLDPLVAPAAMFAVVLSLYMIDCLANAMINLIYIVAIGGLNSAASSRRRFPVSSSDLMLAGHLGPSSDPTQTMSSITLQAASDVSAHESLATRYADMGRALANRGRRREAKAAWFQAFELWSRLTSDDPDNPRLLSSWSDCCNDLACFLMDETDPESQDFFQAVAFATKATEAFPEECIYWNTLGAAYYRAGDAQSAVTALHRAISLQDDRGTAFDHLYLALACARLDQHDIARSWYEQGMNWIKEQPGDHTPLRRLGDEANEVLNQYELAERPDAGT